MASNQLEKKDCLKTSLQAYSLQNGLNHGNYQGLGYANVLYPSLRKMYKDDDDKFQETSEENIELSNTNIHLLSFITGLHLVILENRTSPSEIRNVKTALMGPLAGISDPLTQLCLMPLLAIIGVSLAMDGLITGPILLFVAMSIILLAAKVLIGMWDCKLGTNIIAILNSKVEQISGVASMVGVMVISGLAVNFVKITTPIQCVASMSGDQQKTVAIQDMADVITPRLLPVLSIGSIFYLIKVKKWTTYKLAISTIVIGTVLSLLHIVA